MTESAMEKTFTLTSDASKKAIRQAWAKGKRLLVLNGKVFTLKLQKNKVTYSMSGVVKKRVEQWIVVAPANGTSVPCANIELVDQGNMRTVTPK